MITKEQILNALSNVQEPDLGKDLVSLDMIKNLVIDNKNIQFTIVLTTPACPMKEHMKNACINAIHLLVSKEVHIDIQFTTNKSTTNNIILKGVKNVILVVSGKGGVGKSTVAANMALALQQAGASVGLMDADIYGPSVPLMFGVQDVRPMVKDVQGKPIIIPIDKMGIKLMSIGLLVDEKNAVVWRGPMVSSAIKQFMHDVDWGELDYLIVDMPPGTGDIHLTMMQSTIVTGAVIVTTPQKMALADAKKGIAMFAQAQVNIPIIGLIENMAFFTPNELPNNQYYIFGKSGGKNLATEYDIPFLGEIPIVMGICSGSDNGIPVMMSADNNTKEYIKNIVNNMVREIAKKTVFK